MVHDGTVSRRIPVDAVDGVIEVDATEEPTVTVPPGVTVRRAESARR